MSQRLISSDWLLKRQLWRYSESFNEKEFLLCHQVSFRSNFVSIDTSVHWPPGIRQTLLPLRNMFEMWIPHWREAYTDLQLKQLLRVWKAFSETWNIVKGNAFLVRSINKASSKKPDAKISWERSLTRTANRIDYFYSRDKEKAWSGKHFKW